MDRLLAPLLKRSRSHYLLRNVPERLRVVYAYTLMTDDEKFLFVKNSKSGCTTIAQLMYRYRRGSFLEGSVHRTRDGLRQGLTYWMNYENAFMTQAAFTFTFVRHPETRLVSAYKNFFVDRINRRARIHWGPLKSRGFDERKGLDYNFDVFLDYVEESLSSNELYTDRHWRLQVINVGHGLLDYQFIGKLENFHRDIGEVFQSAGIDRPRLDALPTVQFNRSTRQNITLRNSHRRRIECLFARDYEAFGYEPDSQGLE